MTPNKKHHNTKRGTHIKIGKLTANQKTTHNNRRKQTMNKEAQIWKKINEPKVEGLITGFDKNGKPTYVFRILDRVPEITRKRNKNHMYRSERTPYILNMHGKQSKNKQRGETKQ